MPTGSPWETRALSNVQAGKQAVMHEAVTLAVKAVIGGSLVVAFALFAEMTEPKRFSGVFGAAPAIALASLSVTLVADGAGKAHQAAIGMIAGAVAMVCYCLLASLLLGRLKALRASVVALLGWAAVAAPLYYGFLR